MATVFPQIQLSEAIASIGAFINSSYEVRNGLQFLVTHIKLADRLDDLGLPRWISFARWWRDYKNSWSALAAIGPLLQSRWGGSQKWIDEARADLFHLVVPFLPGQNVSVRTGLSLEQPFVEMCRIDDELNSKRLETGGIYAKYHLRGKDDPELPVRSAKDSDDDFEKLNESIRKLSLEWVDRMTPVAEKLRGSPFVYTVWGYIAVPDRVIEFNRRLARVEKIASTLMAVQADNVPADSSPINLPVHIARPDPNTVESTIVGTLGNETLIGEEIAKKANVTFNSNFKNALSALRKRGILENMSPGYRVSALYRRSCLESGQRSGPMSGLT
jgi:hypothetical protein